MHDKNSLLHTVHIFSFMMLSPECYSLSKDFLRKTEKRVFFPIHCFFLFSKLFIQNLCSKCTLHELVHTPCLIQHFNKTESVPNSLSAPIILIAFFLPSDVTFVQEFWSQTRVKRERFTAVIDVTRVMSLWLLPRPLLIKQKFLKRFLK